LKGDKNGIIITH